MAQLSLCSCPSLPVESVYLGSDNVIRYVLRRDGKAERDLSPILRVVAVVGGVEVDSSVVGPTVIWWTDEVTYKGEISDVLSLRLGGQPLAAGPQTMDVWVTDASNPNGVRWGADIPVVVYPDTSPGMTGS